MHGCAFPIHCALRRHAVRGVQYESVFIYAWAVALRHHQVRTAISRDARFFIVILLAALPISGASAPWNGDHAAGCTPSAVCGEHPWPGSSAGRMTSRRPRSRRAHGSFTDAVRRNLVLGKLQDWCPGGKRTRSGRLISGSPAAMWKWPPPSPASSTLPDWSAEVLRATPREADVIVISGTVFSERWPLSSNIFTTDAGAALGDLHGLLRQFRRNVRHL